MSAQCRLFDVRCQPVAYCGIARGCSWCGPHVMTLTPLGVTPHQNFSLKNGNFINLIFLNTPLSTVVHFHWQSVKVDIPYAYYKPNYSLERATEGGGNNRPHESEIDRAFAATRHASELLVRPYGKFSHFYPAGELTGLCQTPWLVGLPLPQETSLLLAFDLRASECPPLLRQLLFRQPPF